MSAESTEFIADFYDRRFAVVGEEVGSVGWSSVETQSLRFQTLFRGVDVAGMRILDVGCGFGDLFAYLEEHLAGDFNYVGIDVSNALLAVAERRYRATNAVFLKEDYLETDFEGFDIVVQSGAVTLKDGQECERGYRVMRKMHLEAGFVSLGNFLSQESEHRHPKNCYFSRFDLELEARKLSENIVFLEDYGLDEFTVQVFR